MNERLAPHALTQGVQQVPFTAEMIHPTTDPGVGGQSPFVRKSFTVSSGAGPKTLRISALGLYRAFINGQRVGNDLLTPGWTSYWDRLSYQTYNVTALLRDGENTIDIWLGDGWYRSRMMWPRQEILNTWGDKIGAIAELRNAAGDVLLATDSTWQSGLTPIMRSGIYFGERYDARAETGAVMGGTSVLAAFDKSTLIAHEVNGVRELTSLPVAASFADAEGRMVYDFGQNAGGYVAFTVEGEAGASLLIEHAELLDHLGQFDRASMRSAEARVEYVLKGGGPESYRPTFSFFGFRYVRAAITGKARITKIEMLPISSAITPTAAFTSANPLVNRLVQNTIWSQRSNFIEVPTDCPQRDERLGWTGDAQVFAATACYLHESQGMLRKYVRDMIADQRPDGAIPHVIPDPTRNHEDIIPGFYGSTGWGDAICVIPMALYEHYGDREILAEALPAMVKWNDFVWSISNGPIVHPPSGWGGRGFTFGDWLQPQGDFAKPYPTIGDDAAATIYLYISTVLTAKAAEVIGNAAQVKRLQERAAAVKAAFQREFITAAGRIGYNDQTSYALAFLWDLIPAEHIAAAKGYFLETVARAHGRIGTGFIGTPALLPALVKVGEPDLAGAVFLQEGLPGWLFQVKMGATTIWERWNALNEDGVAFDPQMNSYNHYAYGAVCQWLFEAVAGFKPDVENPGFKHVIYEPVILPALSPVAASHDAATGRIEAGWSVAGDKVTYDLVVPAGATGTLVLAKTYREATVDGAPLAQSENAEKTRSPLAPGSHKVTFRISRS
ncbi:family 78 glycoside hydrolase catalytic domain [Devosia sp.]|uniref:family 78 glycoside hydrolase catalytic domain n=1 Tax=Devosia sp. TaxID=1871048 RepID=UPI003BAB5AF1